MKTTQVRLDRETARTCRKIAAECGFLISRGEGAGEIGNIAALLAGLAARYRDDPDGTAQAVESLLNCPKKPQIAS